MLNKTIIALLCFASGCAFAEGSNPEIKPFEEVTTEIDFLRSHSLNDSLSISYVDYGQLFEEGWYDLQKPLFWKSIMRLSADSCVINLGDSREVIEYFSVRDWNRKSNVQKDNYRDSVRLSRGLDSSTPIYMTTGKSDFYTFDNILLDISQGTQIFKEQGVDPWYAQAILMIESPGKLARSTAGAYGSFQLMPGVARNMGLTVNKYRDDRRDFGKSAVGASKLISTICVPEAKKLLDDNGLSYNENDLWFRLFVLHIYHAGAGNVSQVINKINPTEGGMALIQEMWQTKAGRFGNASQNYTQLALAATLILDEMIWGC